MADNRFSRFRALVDKVFPVEQHASVAHEPPPVRHFFDPSTLAPRLKILTAIVFAQVLVSLIMLALRETPALGPPVMIEQLEVTIPWWNYIAAVAATLFCLTLVTLGAAAATGTARVTLFVVFALFYTVQILVFSPQNQDLHFALVFSTLAICVAALRVPASIRRRYSKDRKQLWRLLGLIALCVGLLVAGAIATVRLAPVVVAEYLILLSQALVFFYYLAGVDWAETADIGVHTLMRPLSRMQPAAWLALTLSVCIAGLAVAIHSAWDATLFQQIAESEGGVSRQYTRVMSCSARWNSGESAGAVADCLFQMAAAPYALELIALGGVVVLVLRLAGYRGGLRDHMPWAALVGSIAIWVMAIAAARQSGNPAVMAFTLVFLAAVAIAALKFCDRRARLQVPAQVALFFLVLACYELPSLVPFAQPALAPFKGLLLATGIVSALAAIAIYRRRARYVDVRGPLRLIIALNGAFALLYVLASIIYALLLEVSEHRAIAEAAILFAALIWDVLVSGSSVTNVDGRNFPRHSRVLLFFAYVSGVVAVVVFWGSLAGNAEMLEMAKNYSSAELFVQQGIALFGPAFLLALFVKRLGTCPGNRNRRLRARSGPAGKTEREHVRAPDVPRDVQQG